MIDDRGEISYRELDRRSTALANLASEDNIR